MGSLKDRVEALLEDVGVEASGKLADDVKAVADALGLSYTTVGETVTACERETSSTVHNCCTVTQAETLQTEISESLSDALR